MNDVTVVVKAFERPECLRQLLASVEQLFPDLPVVVADDSREPYADRLAREFKLDVTTVRLPFDSGLSAGRNAAVAAVNTDLFLLMDEDFELSDRESVTCLHEHLRDPSLGVAGGRCRNFHEEAGKPYADWHGTFHRVNRSLWLRKTPSTLYPQRVEVVPNFFVARTDLFRRVPWREDLKIGYEHPMSFLDLRDDGARVIYDGRSCVNHKPLRSLSSKLYRRHRVGTARLREMATRFMNYADIDLFVEISIDGDRRVLCRRR